GEGRIRRSRLTGAQRGVQNSLQYLLRVEVRLGDPAGSAAVPLVVSVDLFQRLHGLAHRGETEDPLAVRQVSARASVLNDGRLPAGQVAERSVADPRILHLHARRLGAAELSTRPLDVVAVGLRAARNLSRIPNPPAMMLQKRPVLSILGR